MIQGLFLLIAGLALLTALGTVLARNLIHAALYLVAFFGLVACLFLLLEAEFLAAVQVLVYIGAVAILLLFGIMLTRNIQGDETTRTGWPAVVASGTVAIGLLSVLVVAIASDRGSRSRPSWRSQTVRPATAAERPTDPLPERARSIHRMPRLIGEELMTRYALAFEMAGLLLTVAVVGAVALSLREERSESRSEDVGSPTDTAESTLTSVGS